MNWIKSHVALLASLLALALAGSALGLALADDGDHTRGEHAAMMKHHARGGAPGRMHDDTGAPGGRYDKGAQRDEMHGPGSMSHDEMHGPGKVRGAHDGDHAAHAAELAAALQQEGVNVTAAQLERAMEETHPADVGSSPASR